MAKYQVWELVTMMVIHDVDAESPADAIARAEARGPMDGELESVHSTEWASVWKLEDDDWKPAEA